MSNLINIADFRKPIGDTPAPEWIFDLRAFYRDGAYEGTIIDFNDSIGSSVGDRLRIYADCLDQLSWFLRQQAEHMEPSDDGVQIATALVFASSRVRVRLNDDKFATAEQMEWLDRRFDDAKEAARISSDT